MITDKSLIKKAQQDKQAFQLVYNKYKTKVFNYFWYRLNYNDELAEDLTQEVFLKAFKHIDKFEERGYSYLTYLLKICHNLFVDYLKQNKGEVWQIRDVPDEIMQKIDDSVDLEILWKDIDKLSLFEKEAMLLRYRRDLPIKQVAQVMGKTENSIKIILSRARQKLKNYSLVINNLTELPDKNI